MDLSKIPLFALMARRMGWLGQRQTVLAENVANADTPGYRPRDLAKPEFARMLEASTHTLRLRGTDPRHLVAFRARGGPAIEKVKDVYETAPSGNAVVIEEQLMKVAQTAMEYRLTAGLYKKHLAMIKAALGRGG